MNSFDACIHAACISDACKLNRLLDLGKGKAQSVIRSCSLMQPTQGYNKARSLLEQRFGNEYVIAEAWISKITQGPPIKKFSGEALHDFADEVWSCAETLRAMGRIGEVDSRVRLVKLTERLPFQLQGR